jgi:hypothetical protein
MVAAVGAAIRERAHPCIHLSQEILRVSKDGEMIAGGEQDKFLLWGVDTVKVSFGDLG